MAGWLRVGARHRDRASPRGPLAPSRARHDARRRQGVPGRAHSGRGRLGSASVPGLLDYPVVLAPPKRPSLLADELSRLLRRPSLRAGRSKLPEPAGAGRHRGDAGDTAGRGALPGPPVGARPPAPGSRHRRAARNRGRRGGGGRGRRRQVRALETTGPLWRLRASCLHYCRFVHHHHRLEDRALFPELRRVNPSLGPVVDRLQEDHRRVAGLLEGVESAVEDWTATTPRPSALGGRRRSKRSRRHLLAHLELEEESVAETLRRWEPRGA